MSSQNNRTKWQRQPRLTNSQRANKLLNRNRTQLTTRTGQTAATQHQHDLIHALRLKLNLTPHPQTHQITRLEAQDEIETYKHRIGETGN